MSQTASENAAGLKKKTVTICKGDTFFEILKRNGVTPADALKIAKQADTVFDIRSIKPGKTLNLFFNTQTGELARLNYEISKKQTLLVTVSDSIWAGRVSGDPERSGAGVTAPVQNRSAKADTVVHSGKKLLKVAVTIRKGETLVGILTRHGLSRAEVYRLDRQISSTYPLAASMKSGHDMCIWMPSNQPGTLTHLTYEIDKSKQLVVTADAAGYSARITGSPEASGASAAAPANTVNASAPILEQAPATVVLSSGPQHKPDMKEWTEQLALRQVDVIIEKGILLDSILSKHGMSRSEIYRLAAHVRSVYPLARNIKPGHGLHLWFRNDENNSLQRLIYEIDSSRQLLVIAQAGGYAASIVPAASQENVLKNEEVSRNDSALNTTSGAVGSPYALAGLFPDHFDVFAQPRSFDVYAIALHNANAEEAEDTEDAPQDRQTEIESDIRTSKLRPEQSEKIAERPHSNKPKEVRIASRDQKKARSRAERFFLNAPLNYRRVSSGFSYCRKHPLLGIERPHLGVDFAAPVGTPVRALGRGQVIYVGYSPGFGRAIHVKHPNGYITYYAHLSRYAKGLSVRKNVGKGEVIGYVGSSGISSGPHLDFRVSCRGKFIDPLKLKNYGNPVVSSGETRVATKKKSKNQRQARSSKKDDTVVKNQTVQSRVLAKKLN